MKVTLEPELPTLAAYEHFVQYQPRSHAFTSWIKSLASNFSIDPSAVQVTFVPASTEEGRDDLNLMLSRLTAVIERAPELQDEFTRLADAVTAADNTDELLTLLPEVSKLAETVAAYPRAVGGVAG